MHAGATVLIKHSESQVGEVQEFGARGWRVAQEGAAIMASFMRRRIIFVSLTVARLLLLSDARVVRSSDLEGLEAHKQLLNLSSCRNQDGYIEAGGAVCVICPTTVIPAEEVAEADTQPVPTVASPWEGSEDHRMLATKHPISDNPSFVTLADSFCVACMITKGGNLHAYMNRKEAKALASHLFSVPKECPESSEAP